MIQRATTSTKAARDFVKMCEAAGGPVLYAYKKSAEDPVTAMYGFTGQIVDPESGELRPMIPKRWPGADEDNEEFDTFTLEQAEFYYEQDCHEAERRVDFFFKNVPLTQNQRDALFSFCFNLRWDSILNSSLRRFILAGERTDENEGGWIRETMLEWWPKYRNPRTIFEEGLYRRRLAELSVFLDNVPWSTAYKEAWRANLKRDREGGILQISNPELIIMRAQQAAVPAPAPAPTPQPPRVPENEPAPPVIETVPAPVPEPEIEAPAPPLPPVAAPRSSTQTPAAGPKMQLTRAQFWSLQVLIFGRIGLFLGIIPAAASEMINDPAFQTAVGGVVAIYAGMFLVWITGRQREKAEKANE